MLSVIAVGNKFGLRIDDAEKLLAVLSGDTDIPKEDYDILWNVINAINEYVYSDRNVFVAEEIGGSLNLEGYPTEIPILKDATAFPEIKKLLQLLCSVFNEHYRISSECDKYTIQSYATYMEMGHSISKYGTDLFMVVDWKFV